MDDVEKLKTLVREYPEIKGMWTHGEKASDLIWRIIDSMRGGITCEDCGAPYYELGVDIVLPDQQWKAIHPDEGGVLCANCICKRAEKVGGTALLAWINNLDWSLARND